MTIMETRRSRITKSNQVSQLPAVVYAIWGPHGSPGKSIIALNLAYEFATLGKSVLLIDLDNNAPSQGLLVGSELNQPGIAAVARLIRQSRFDLEQLDRLALNIRHKRVSFKLLTGLTATSRWPEVTEETVTQLLNLARTRFDVIILDLASNLEASIIDTSHTTARNAVTRKAIQQSDSTLVILRETKLSLQRYLENHAQVTELQPHHQLILNQSSRSQTFAKALKTLVNEQPLATIPDDQASIELAQAEALPLALVRRKSPARWAIGELANRLLVCPPSAS